jgi:hypothetical protein
MAKGQKRSNRETRKPKQPKKAASAPTLAATGGADSIRTTFAASRNNGKKSRA